MLADGSRAVLKVGLPGSADLGGEARVYRLAAGRGYANLLAHDEAHNALLLERLGEPLADTGVSVEQQMRQICAALKPAWIPLRESHGLMTGAQKAHWLAGFIEEKWASLDKPCARRTVDMALAFAQMRATAHSASDSVLVHGDAHAHNALADGGGGFRFVDPDGLFAEPACDLAALMRDWSDELLAGDPVANSRRRCDLLVELTGAEQEAVWQWGFIERVSTGLVLLEIGMTDEGVATLAVADYLSDD
jgi:streptomycin 6-kinase